MKNLIILILLLIPVLSNCQYATNKLTPEQIDVNLYLIEASDDINSGAGWIIVGSALGIVSSVLYLADADKNVRTSARLIGGSFLCTAIGGYKISVGSRKRTRSLKRLNQLGKY